MYIPVYLYYISECFICFCKSLHIELRSVCSSPKPDQFTHSILLKLGLEIAWHGIAASRILITSPFSRYYNKGKYTKTDTQLLRYHQN